MKKENLLYSQKGDTKVTESLTANTVTKEEEDIDP
jgi:hypothetical protein